jgi:tetratricopeptide (TPR) repeat protein
MKKEMNFWRSLEEYSWKVVKRNPLPWQWVGIGLIVIVLLTSAVSAKNSMVGARNIREAIEIAVSLGDYETAQALFDKMLDSRSKMLVLGAESELEDKVYPERVVERRVIELEDKLEIYPGNREIYLSLATLYQTLGNQEIADEYREKARILDPNDIEFK